MSRPNSCNLKIASLPYLFSKLKEQRQRVEADKAQLAAELTGSGLTIPQCGGVGGSGGNARGVSPVRILFPEETGPSAPTTRAQACKPKLPPKADNSRSQKHRPNILRKL